MGPSSTGSTGYNWSDTSQWSQIPTGNANQTTQPSNGQNMPQNTPANNAYQQPQAITEPRKDMIARLYKTILGREADTAGLNYYLYNTYLGEAQIAKEMYESTEHNEMLAKARDIREMVKRTEEAHKKMTDMELTLHSLQALNDSYKNLLDQKSHVINQIKAEYKIEDFSKFNPNQETAPSTSHTTESLAAEQTISDYILEDPFEGESTRRKSIVNWLKGWFEFK
jgi:hypothetical protein